MGAQKVTPVLDLFSGAYLRVHRLLADTADSQWIAGKTPVLKEDTTERSIGLTTDPTATAALDTRRWNLREAVVNAESAVKAANLALLTAEAKLKRALKEVTDETD